jgi:3'-phosphoadenosine 5'-phosphosulfate sulfotransferase (PAPS reductase)/FAD synthetase
MKIIVPISGGKDSQACMKMAVEQHGAANVEGLFCDTKFEHPITYEHIDRIATLYGVTIHRVCGGSVDAEVLRYGYFPGAAGRHCTDRLKLRQSRIWYGKQALARGGFEAWVGVRMAESSKRAKRYADKQGGELLPPHEFMPGTFPKYLQKRGVMFRLPILEWSSAEVLEYLAGEENPLYRAGFDRVGCFPCLASGDRWKEKAFNHDDFGRQQRERVAKLERATGKNIFTSKGGIRRNSPDQCDIFGGAGCSICAI